MPGPPARDGAHGVRCEVHKIVSSAKGPTTEMSNARHAERAVDEVRGRQLDKVLTKRKLSDGIVTIPGIVDNRGHIPGIVDNRGNKSS
jgi:hypothetical protein